MRIRRRTPTHPGRILKDLYMIPLDITNVRLAEILGVSRKVISNIVNERKAITPEIALRLSRAFTNTTPESWLNLQRNYDLWYTAHNTHDWENVQPVPMSEITTS